MPKATAQVTMAGASGTGKTTALTSIHEQFNLIVEKLGIKLDPDSETQAILNKNLKLLRNLENVIISGEFESKTRDKKKAGISGTESMSPDSLPSYKFDLERKEGNNLLELVFRDYPGGYIKQERKFVQDLFRGSDSVILTIDTPAMLVRGGAWHTLRNQPNEILESFQAAYTKVDRPRLVVLALVKCEKFVKTKEDVQNLLETTKQVYKPLLDFLGDPSRSNNFAVLFAPIQTVGCLEFSSVEEKDGPRFKFRLKETGAKYDPKCTDRLLIYLLGFLFKQANDQSIQVKSVTVRKLREIFKHDTVFEKLSKKILELNEKITDCGFRILQGKDLLS